MNFTAFRTRHDIYGLLADMNLRDDSLNAFKKKKYQPNSLHNNHQSFKKKYFQ